MALRFLSDWFQSLRRPGHHHGGVLTEREVEILRIVQTGLSNKDIAARLGLSKSTVQNHLTNVFVKLDVTNRTEAVFQGVKRGLLD